MASRNDALDRWRQEREQKLRRAAVVPVEPDVDLAERHDGGVLVRRLGGSARVAVTAVLGMVPMAVGVSFDFHHFAIQIGSEQAEFWKAFAWAMIYGLTFATMMTLILVPTMLTLKFRHLDAKARRKQARLEAKAKI